LNTPVAEGRRPADYATQNAGSVGSSLPPIRTGIDADCLKSKDFDPTSGTGTVPASPKSGRYPLRQASVAKNPLTPQMLLAR